MAEQKSTYSQIQMSVMPVKQAHHNNPHTDTQTYFNLIFHSDCPQYKGKIPIAVRCKDGTLRMIGVVPVAELGTWTAQMHVSTQMDYYYGKAQQSRYATWACESALCYNLIAVDIDAHSTHHTDADQHLVDCLIHWLTEDGYPAPNIVEFTGRGIHLVWCIEQISAKLDWMVRAVSADYASAVHRLLCTHSWIAGYKVDMSYSKNIAGLTRLPGTYNTASRTYATYEILHQHRLDLPKAYDSIRTAPCPASHLPRYAVNAGQRRVAALLRLLEIRPIQEGQRDLYLFHLFSACQMAGMSNPDALDYVQSVNNALACPLSYREVERNLSTAARKKYHYTNQQIIEALEITPSEQVLIGLHTSAHRDTNKARRTRNAQKKLVRDRNIMKLHLTGLSVAAIARVVEHAYNTVRKVITQYIRNLSALFSTMELYAIFLEQRTQSGTKTQHMQKAWKAFSKNEALNIIPIWDKHFPNWRWSTARHRLRQNLKDLFPRLHQMACNTATGGADSLL